MDAVTSSAINKLSNSSKQDLRKLSLVSAQVGGEVIFMIGMQYMLYHPKFVFQLPSRLTTFESHFKSADRSSVIGCPTEYSERSIISIITL